MTFEETQSTIEEYLESNQNIINKRLCENLNEILKIVYEDIKLLSETGKFVNTTLNFSNLLDIVTSMSQLVLTAPLGENFSMFILAFSELVFNWNNNTHKNNTISVLVKFMTSTINSKNDILQTVRKIKEVDEKLKTISGWSPAAFDIAIAYVDEQLKVNETGSKP